MSFFKGHQKEILNDNDEINIGGRKIQILHTPGHSPGHMCFGKMIVVYIFTGDLIYKDTLFAYYPSTDPDLYLKSLIKLSNLPVDKVFPAHHSLDIGPEIITRMKDAFIDLKNKASYIMVAELMIMETGLFGCKKKAPNTYKVHAVKRNLRK
jgi:glyoxylase-like metal-dependent hydrolase (beta-lactamase superfamily II)